ncbi:glycosyltransferase family 2 protein [Candidatus Nitrotoga sp. 1052]|uniref:glycosyltransferase family 2 protein n=1 Tax=Candidatus Nitrotoga sp. 1052 TaxID=2886964 RepID=UPI001EF45DF4|nr:glycosyltransferase family 2 protein [Candidatus Nitrotoga sp. 1052]CAH1072869.1 Glycosyltransferase involved in cell wall bisynthesis [Candidatus Nitrotoga sp. 1052]
MTPEVSKPNKVTVLLSTYNGSKYLQQQLNSLYEQTYPNIRILVRDDGSSDSTRNILENEQLSGRIDILRGHKNLGPALSFFELLHNAALTETEYVAFCDQDDVWHPHKIAHAVSALVVVTDNRPALFCSRLEIVDEQLNHIGFTNTPRKVGFGNALVENVATGCTMVLNRKAVELICKHLPSKVLMHDWWCYLVLSCFGEIIFDSNANIKYRQHGNNTIGATVNMFDELKRKLHRFIYSGKGLLWLQASVFSNMFENGIPISQRLVLNKFIAAKSSLWCRVQLVLSKEIWRQKWFDNLILRFIIFINRI